MTSPAASSTTSSSGCGRVGSTSPASSGREATGRGGPTVERPRFRRGAGRVVLGSPCGARLGLNRLKGARVERPSELEPGKSRAALRADHGPERSVFVRVSVAVPGTWTGRRGGAYDFPVAWEGVGTRDQDLATLTGHRVHDGKRRRRGGDGEGGTTDQHQRRDSLPHLNLLTRQHVSTRPATKDARLIRAALLQDD
jgi:hypothetical protein